MDQLLDSAKRFLRHPSGGQIQTGLTQVFRYFLAVFSSIPAFSALSLNVFLFDNIFFSFLT
jgi:hypothetical protein